MVVQHNAVHVCCVYGELMGVDGVRPTAIYISLLMDYLGFIRNRGDLFISFK